MTATPPNINDPELAPGGSSSGAAASVAFGLAAAAIGSDTAGSVRVPAAWNDLVGLKTTHGAAVRSTASCRCARPSTPSARSPARSRTQRCSSPPSGGPATDLAGADLGGRAASSCSRTRRCCPTRDGPRAGLRGRRSPGSPPPAPGSTARRPRRRRRGAALWPTVAGAEAYGVWRDAIEARPELMFAPIRDRFRAGREHPRRRLRRRAARPRPRSAPPGGPRPRPTTRCCCRPPRTCRRTSSGCFAEPEHFTTENLLGAAQPRPRQPARPLRGDPAHRHAVLRADALREALRRGPPPPPRRRGGARPRQLRRRLRLPGVRCSMSRH